MRQNPSDSRYIDGKPMAGYQSSTDRTSMGNDQPLTLSKEVGFFSWRWGPSITTSIHHKYYRYARPSSGQVSGNLNTLRRTRRIKAPKENMTLAQQ